MDEDTYIADPPETVLPDSDSMNHSCDPSIWMDDEVTISARRDIEPGEEVTADYAPWVTNPRHMMIADCHCRSPLCQKTITGDDWKMIGGWKNRYKIKLRRGRRSFINSQKRFAEADERPVVTPRVVDPVMVELAVVVVEVGIRGVEAAIGFTPAAHFL